MYGYAHRTYRSRYENVVENMMFVCDPRTSDHCRLVRALDSTLQTGHCNVRIVVLSLFSCYFEGFKADTIQLADYVSGPGQHPVLLRACVCVYVNVIMGCHFNAYTTMACMYVDRVDAQPSNPANNRYMCTARTLCIAVVKLSPHSTL